MPKSNKDLFSGFAGEDVLAAYRKRTWSLFAGIFLAFFLPGSILIFWNGYKMLAAGVLCLLAAMTINGYRIKKDRPPLVKIPIFIALLMFVISFSTLQRGEYGMFWTFPAILIINFVAFGKLARIYTSVFIVFIGTVMFYALDVMIAARAVIALIVVVLLTNTFLGMIDKLQRILVEQTIRDPLTGALNRREMGSILQEAVERKRRRRTPASLLVFDVDRFKSVNDKYGHAVGDHVLKQLAVVVGGRARLLDRLFRMGGEEFMLFLPDTDIVGAVTLAESLRLLVSETVFIDDRVITISIGITELEPDESVDDWIRRGDDALYYAKENGRNRAVEASPAQDHARPANSIANIASPTFSA